MAWLPHPVLPPAGVLASRRQAQPALLRMLGRARRHHGGLLLARLGVAAAPPAAAAAEAAQQRFLAAAAGELRLTDLAWAEPGAGLMLLLEAAAEESEVRQRLEQRAAACQLRLRWQAARFPEQGLTLEALLDTVQWPR